jgi:para-nitrobenzyl esterase
MRRMATMSELVVSTASGKVRGLHKDGACHWRGIPYAAPPLGALRFLPPRPPVPWTGERDATRFGALAEQSRDPRIAMMSGVSNKLALSEDCLVLNVCSPAADGARRPVVVWIHGGGFIMGSGSQPLFNGSSFAAHHDVVVVTINYRLGLLGLLYLGELAGEPYRHGNVALLDQLAALRWVRENIAAFGGDPARVTVMGESAGAISVASLLGMPAARGLFDRAILQSGASELAPPSRASATAFARGVLAELGVGVAGLADVPAARLVALQEQLVQSRGLGVFTPYVDGETIPRPPTEAVRDGAGVQVPILIGSNQDEWALFDVVMGPAATSLLKAHLISRLGDDVLRIHAARRDARAARRDGADAARARSPDDGAWIDVIGDVVFRIPVLRLADAQARHAPVWMYRFDWHSPAFDGRLGAAHALELPFVWNQLDLPISQLLLGGDLAGARPLGAHMHAAWAAFIRGGDPAAAGLPAWPRYGEPRRATMVLDREPRVADDPDAALRELWSTIYPPR